MVLDFLLVLDAIALIIATSALTYFFIREILKEKNKEKK